MMLRLLDLFKAMSPAKTNKKPGQKLATYEGCLGFQEGREYKTKRVPTTQRGTLRCGTHEAQRRKYTTTRLEAEADWVHYYLLTGRDTCSYLGRVTP